MKVSKQNLVFILLCSVLISCSQKKMMSTQVNYTQLYCGGARPSAEMLADAEKAKPYSGKTIVIVSSKGKVDSAKTDVTGLLKVNLKIGTYKLFEAWRYYKKAAAGMLVSDFEKECLKGEWKKEIKEVIITKKEITISDKNAIVEVCPWNLPCILESHKPPAHE